MNKKNRHAWLTTIRDSREGDVLLCTESSIPHFWESVLYLSVVGGIPIEFHDVVSVPAPFQSGSILHTLTRIK
jgi:hypothetical protein